MFSLITFRSTFRISLRWSKIQTLIQSCQKMNEKSMSRTYLLISNSFIKNATIFKRYQMHTSKSELILHLIASIEKHLYRFQKKEKQFLKVLSQWILTLMILTSCTKCSSQNTQSMRIGELEIKQFLLLEWLQRKCLLM